MSTTEADPAVHPDFVDPDHDIVIQAGDAVNEDGTLDRASLFQLRKSALVAISGVFADMVSMPGSGSAVKDEPLQLEETGPVLSMVLAYTRPDVDAFPDLDNLSMNFDLLLNMWEASIKYAMLIPQAFIEAQIL